MKRILILGIVALFIMMPLASFAKTVISDNELAGVTAETGVSIVFTNVNVGNNATTLTSAAWGDSDGFSSPYTGQGWLGISNVTITGNLAQLNGTMNMDVGSSGTATRLNIDLPTMTLGTMNVLATMKLGTTADLTGSSSILGYVDIRGFSTTVSGSIQVYAH